MLVSIKRSVVVLARPCFTWQATVNNTVYCMPCTAHTSHLLTSTRSSQVFIKKFSFVYDVYGGVISGHYHSFKVFEDSVQHPKYFWCLWTFFLYFVNNSATVHPSMATGMSNFIDIIPSQITIIYSESLEGTLIKINRYQEYLEKSTL